MVVMILLISDGVMPPKIASVRGVLLFPTHMIVLDSECCQGTMKIVGPMT